jgi:hypothetical protein
MTITLSNPVMTFQNNTGGMMGGGGMMGEAGCAKDQICQINPTMMALSISITGPPFPINLQANTSFNLQMDFDLMDSLQSNMSVNPMMSSMMQEGPLGSDVFDDMDDMIGQVSAVNSGSNQLTMSFVQGMPSMTITADANTSFEGFDGIGKPNSFAGLAQGQIVLARVQLLAGGSLHAEKIRFETSNPRVLDGMIVAVNNSTQFDMVITNEAPAFAGMNVGSLLRMNVQAGSVFDMDDMDMPVSGMSFTSPSDLMVGQVVQIEPTSELVNGTPPELNINNLRLMKTWMTAKVASKIDPNTFSVNSLPGMFGNVGIATIKISGSAQTSFENVSGISALNAGDTVSVRGPMFLTSGMPTFIASKIQKR